VSGWGLYLRLAVIAFVQSAKGQVLIQVRPRQTKW